MAKRKTRKVASRKSKTKTKRAKPVRRALPKRKKRAAKKKNGGGGGGGQRAMPPSAPHGTGGGPDDI